MTRIKGSALITGAAQRVGKAMAINLARQGYNIAIHYNSAAEKAKQLQEEISNMGVKCAIFQADFTQTATVDKLFKQVWQNFPDLNILFNNASIFIKKSFLATDEEFFQQNCNSPLS